MNQLFDPKIIKAQLAYLGMSQAELAKRAKLSNPRVSRILTSRFQPRIDEIAKIGTALEKACTGEGLSGIGVVPKTQKDPLLPYKARAAGNGYVEINLDGSQHLVSPAEAGVIADFIDDALANLGQPRRS